MGPSLSRRDSVYLSTHRRLDWAEANMPLWCADTSLSALMESMPFMLGLWHAGCDNPSMPPQDDARRGQGRAPARPKATQGRCGPAPLAPAPAAAPAAGGRRALA